MPDKIFRSMEVGEDKKKEIDELTIAELRDPSKPFELSEELKKILDSKFAIFIAHKESKAIRLIPIKSTRIIKLVIYLQDVSEFIKEILKFYQKHNIEIVYTSGICFKGDNMEDCVYESYIDIRNCEGMTDVTIIEELEKIEGIEKIFIVPINGDTCGD